VGARPTGSRVCALERINLTPEGQHEGINSVPSRGGEKIFLPFDQREWPLYWGSTENMAVARSVAGFQCVEHRLKGICSPGKRKHIPCYRSPLAGNSTYTHSYASEKNVRANQRDRRSVMSHRAVTDCREVERLLGNGLPIRRHSRARFTRIMEVGPSR
jgi:hypothetical protein